MKTGTRITEEGLLVREGGGFALRGDTQGRLRLDLHRTPVDHVEKRVRISGIYIDEAVVEVEQISAAE